MNGEKSQYESPVQMQTGPSQNQTSPKELMLPNNLIDIDEDGTLTSEANSFTLNYFLEKIGFGGFHLKRFFTVGMIGIMDGGVIMTFSLTVVMLAREWAISEELQSLVVSAVFVAVVVGAYCAGPIADKFGRRMPMFINCFLIVLFNIISAFSTNIGMYAITRCLLAFVCGFYSPIGFTYVLEIMPPSLRGRVMTMGYAMLFVGQLFVCFVGLFTLETLDQGNWRLLTLWSTLPGVLSFILSFFYLDESVRYLLLHRKLDEAIRILEKSAEDAWRSDITSITEQHRTQLKIWMETQTAAPKSKDKAPGIGLLFGKNYRILTLVIWFTWFATNFVYYGLTLFFPYMLNEATKREFQKLEIDEEVDVNLSESNLGGLTLSISLESLSVVIAYFVIDKKLWGRKKAMLVFYGLTCIFSIIAYFDRSRINMILWTTLMKIVLDVCGFYNFMVTLEAYPTQFRATGVGAATAVGKAGTILMPWVCGMLLQYSEYGPYIGFAVVTALASVTAMLLPYDTSEIEMK